MSAWLSSVMNGSSSAPPVRFCVGDTVNVLSAIALPKFEKVIHTGEVQRITERDGLPTLYWIAGLPAARTAPVLRLVRRANRETCHSCDGDGFGPVGSMGNCATCGGSGKV